MPDSIEISRELACQVLWVFGYEGFPGGTFQSKVLDLIAHADKVNEARLTLAFPAEVAAVRIAKHDEDGIAKLRAIADGQAAA
ncbi:hypothetical protein ADK55_18485 [Streptomyces sp. WM4235]|uniref:hypothetical protein n=1 Tax=Streptomyces sp. WM4235 TaxID=1415551 RepID=UPI0006AD907F|nr:hypothetical protein [Streptomyces sp. WM4235]KOU50537.1 hypothetical protein ADK55_18485 [Streptomyces sp. WM4235]